jgi:hypothetical protein
VTGKAGDAVVPDDVARGKLGRNRAVWAEDHPPDRDRLACGELGRLERHRDAVVGSHQGRLADDGRRIGHLPGEVVPFEHVRRLFGRGFGLRHERQREREERDGDAKTDLHHVLPFSPDVLGLPRRDCRRARRDWGRSRRSR